MKEGEPGLTSGPCHLICQAGGDWRALGSRGEEEPAKMSGLVSRPGAMKAPCWVLRLLVPTLSRDC